MTNKITVLHASTFTLTSSLKSPVVAVVAAVLVEVVLVLVLVLAVAVVLVALTYNQFHSHISTLPAHSPP